MDETFQAASDLPGIGFLRSLPGHLHDQSIVALNEVVWRRIALNRRRDPNHVCYFTIRPNRQDRQFEGLIIDYLDALRQAVAEQPGNLPALHMSPINGPPGRGGGN